MKIIFKSLIFFFAVFYSINAFGQEDRFQVIEQRLKDLSFQSPGLNQNAELSVSNVSIIEILRGLASTHNLNINIDPSIDQKVTNNFYKEKVINIILFLIKQYNLDIKFIGSIMTFIPYYDPLKNTPPKPKELNISYNQSDETVSFDLANDTLLEVAKKITHLSNKNVVVLPEVFYRTISGYVQNLPLFNALEKLSLSNNLKLTKTNDNVFVIGALAPDEELILKTPTQTNPSTIIRRTNKNDPGKNNSSAEINTTQNGKKTISLNILNTPITDVIKNLSSQAGINYFIYSELKGNITANANNIDFDDAISYILQGTDYTYKVYNNIYMIGEREKEGLRSNKVIQLKYRSVDSILTFIPPDIRKGVEIREFKELNSFLVTGSSPQINEIEAFVKNIDKLVPMIMIEVILLDVKKSKTIKTGISAGVADSTVKTGGTILSGLDFTAGAGSINNFINRIGLNNVFNIGRVAPNFYVKLQALENNNNIELRQTPKLSTLNGHKATLSIGSTRYYAITTQNVLGSLNPQTIVTQQFIPVEANLAIDIRPIVSGDDQVTMNIDVNIADFIGIPPSNSPPPTSKSMFSSIIRVHNDEMIVLGGIERTEKSQDGSGIPFLARIPVLKWLFSSRSKTDSKVVSVVFIKPTIIY
jgi:type IV pilus assembly protein PilQ